MTNATQSSSLLVDTALAMMAETGLDDLTLTAVARRAGVSRATVYREFGDKNGLIAAVSRIEVARMASAAYLEIDMFAPVRQLAKGAVVFAIPYLRRHPVIARLRDHEPAWLLDVAIEHGGSQLNLIDTVGAFIAPLLAARDDRESLVVTPAQAAEIAVRAVLSHVLIERSSLTDEQVGDAVARAVSR
ncbi:TetR/AcrR family transcriptional regulator [Nocardia sp. NPDC058633]|uniref:TetR/AcrR family transcriptional regulator n=1 Tax=Nocardia sp. NPDC058633 TaxID=3346568 RepID=UPI00365F0C9E